MMAVLCACGDTDKDQNGSATAGGSGSEGAMLSEDASSSGEGGAGASVSDDPENTQEKDSPLNTESGDAPYYGTWVIQTYEPSDTSVLTEEGTEALKLTLDEIKAFSGDTLVYQPDAALHNGERTELREGAYQTEPYTMELLEKNYFLNLGEWWNGVKDITRVTVEAPEEFFGDEFFYVDDETLWIYHEGAFFMAKKI